MVAALRNILAAFHCDGRVKLRIVNIINRLEVALSLK